MAYIAQKKFEGESLSNKKERTLFIILAASNMSNGNEMEIQWERYYVIL